MPVNADSSKVIFLNLVADCLVLLFSGA